MALPFLSTETFQPAGTDIVLERAFLIVEPAKLQWLDDAIHDHGGAEARAQSHEQHLASLVAAEGLHGRVVDDLHGMGERSGEIKPHPSPTKIAWLRHGLP